MKNSVSFNSFEGNKSNPILIRIGDFMAYMIIISFHKNIKNKHIVYYNSSTLHQSFKSTILFKNLFDTVHTDQIAPENENIFDISKKIGFWTYAPKLIKKYGSKIIPKVNLDHREYNGPNLSWGNYIIFNPLFSAQYNISRNMDSNFINNLILKLYQEFGSRLIVITDKPEFITDKFTQVLVSDDLYSLMYIIARAGVYIGGDTGFTHFAAIARVPLLITMYGTKYPVKYEKYNFNANPMIDKDTTKFYNYMLLNNRISKKNIKKLIQNISERAL